MKAKVKNFEVIVQPMTKFEFYDKIKKYQIQHPENKRINGYYFLVNSTNKMYQLQTNDIITLSNGVIIPDIIFESEDYKTYCSDIVLKVELQALWNVGGYSIEEADVNFSNKYGGSAFN